MEGKDKKLVLFKFVSGFVLPLVCNNFKYGENFLTSKMNMSEVHGIYPEYINDDLLECVFSIPIKWSESDGIILMPMEDKLSEYIKKILEMTGQKYLIYS